MPSIWVARAGADLNVPAEILDDLCRAYRLAGGSIEMTDYAGQVHGFGHTPGAATDQFLADLRVQLRKAFSN